MNSPYDSGKRFRKVDYWGIRKFKRHSLVLTVAGLVYMLVGITYIWAVPTQNRKIALAIAFEWFPIEFWGSVFIFVGLMAVISSRWPPISETWGYLPLTGLSAGWAATYAAGVIFDDSPIANLTGTLNWGLLAFVWWSISGFVSPDKTVVVVIKDDDKGTDIR